MIGYVQNDSECRSKQLLAYFGEQLQEDCQQCDVCECKAQQEAAANKSHENDASDAIASHVLAILADHQQHHISELYTETIPSPQLMEVIQHLLQEERIKARGVLLSI